MRNFKTNTRQSVCNKRGESKHLGVRPSRPPQCMFLSHVQALTKPLLPHHYLRTIAVQRLNTITSTRPPLPGPRTSPPHSGARPCPSYGFCHKRHFRRSLASGRSQWQCPHQHAPRLSLPRICAYCQSYSSPLWPSCACARGRGAPQERCQPDSLFGCSPRARSGWWCLCGSNHRVSSMPVFTAHTY
jgi:hypothetical protein